MLNTGQSAPLSPRGGESAASVGEQDAIWLFCRPHGGHRASRGPPGCDVALGSAVTFLPISALSSVTVDDEDGGRRGDEAPGVGSRLPLLPR